MQVHHQSDRKVFNFRTNTHEVIPGYFENFQGDKSDLLERYGRPLRKERSGKWERWFYVGFTISFEV